MTLRYTKPPSQRQLRVGEVIRAEISHLLNKGIMINYGLDGVMLSVSEVRISPDLKIATAFLSSPIEDDRKRVTGILKNLSTDIRRMITPRLNLRFSPEIRLTFDKNTSVDNIEKILINLKTQN